MTTIYRLTSSELVYAPGVVAFAINGAKFKKDREQMIRMIAKGWGVPFPAACALIKGKVPYTVEGDVVVFTHTMEEKSQNEVSKESV